MWRYFKMAKLIFKYDKDSDYSKQNREVSEVQLNVPDELDIWEFKIIVKRLASSLGFADNSIQRCFGSDTDLKKKRETRQLLLDSITNMRKEL